MADAAEGSSPGPEALLERARACEERQRHGDALLAYYRAIIESQRQGRWLNAQTTPAALLGRVTYAIRYVKAGRRRVLGHALEPVYVRHGRDALARFERCLASQIGEAATQPPDPRQRPSILYFPGLPSAPYFERSLFPWFAQLESEAGAMPSEQLLSEMGRFNEELVNAGVLHAGEGLQPSSHGARVRFAGKERHVTAGPFARTSELVAGFWVWECASLQEAIDWVKRCPNPMLGESEFEIRPIFEPDDFGDALTPELREQEERLRQQVAEQAR